ncbi:acetyl esterase/lipase [Prosthecobacter fusiformis]|uniref:Acetyl esterase/lipase n=1 Tax=Prosthecobacter fusiformis TaxID=48464 RepID=A0A4R7RW86_9BACT|nr:alpha/beta hydrolase [Prosthecobacter fusiformis]TDU69268.1 acetyl esterase/lipase [Prosthecobacter fusiformis]
MKRLSLVSSLLLSIAALAPAAEPVVIKLWPKGAPEAEGFKIEPEAEIKREKDDGVKRLGNVSDPTITIYPAENPNGTAVLVCPGGGYGILAIEHEGTQVCDYLKTIGVTPVLLKYRVPRRDPTDPSRVPLQDTQRAMGILRHRAAEFGIQPDRIGILGFSAGGHLSIMTALHANERTYEQDPALDVEDATPNFAVPVYPAYLVEKENAFQLVPEIKISAKAPPMCLIHAHDDPHSAGGSALIYLEYKKNNIPCEVHIYSTGGHGFGMKKNGLPVNDWLLRVAEWMPTLTKAK